MDNYTNLCRAFISREKSLLIAPAGCGKTYTIAECLKYTEGRQLILTHTHAGVASIKEKINKMSIPTNKYMIETIDSYAQKYVNAFYCKNDIPQQDSNEYFRFIIEKATQLVKIKPINDIIKLTYRGLLVDEYQDCTQSQHEFIMALSEILPTHLLGDHLQGIFGFREQLVNFEEDLKDFEQFRLDEPWRWKNTNPELGKCLMEIRKKLENYEDKDINLNTIGNAFEVVNIQEADIFRKGSLYNKKIWELLNEDNLLIIHPESEKNIRVRKKIIKNFKNRLYLVEAIDGKDFYEFSRKFDDNSTPENIYKTIYDFICEIFNMGEISYWFDEKKLKNKQDEKDKRKIQPIRENLKKLEEKVSFILVACILKQIKNLPNIKCYRKELFNDICNALEEAEYSNISVYEAMKKIKNRKRRMGRKIDGKCIGTTLLIKGLEFKNVAILDAHKFKDPKNLYVALTRASHKLIIFTNNSILSPSSQ